MEACASEFEYLSSMFAARMTGVADELASEVAPWISGLEVDIEEIKRRVGELSLDLVDRCTLKPTMAVAGVIAGTRPGIHPYGDDLHTSLSSRIGSGGGCDWARRPHPECDPGVSLGGSQVPGTTQPTPGPDSMGSRRKTIRLICAMLRPRPCRRHLCFRLGPATGCSGDRTFTC